MDELSKNDIKNQHLSKNQEGFRQYDRKLERTADAVLQMISKNES